MTIKLLTPKAFNNKVCSRVEPCLSKPASNSPFLAEMTRPATSAWHAPNNKLGIYPACPGASNKVKRL